MKNCNSKIPDSFTRKPIANTITAPVDYVRLIGLLPLCLSTSAMAAEPIQEQPKEETVVLESIIVTSKKKLGTIKRDMERLRLLELQKKVAA